MLSFVRGNRKNIWSKYFNVHAEHCRKRKTRLHFETAGKSYAQNHLTFRFGRLIQTVTSEHFFKTGLNFNSSFYAYTL